VTKIQVDEVNGVLIWFMVQVAESKLIEDELDWKGPTFF
jgi:hypothetical protein